MVRMGKDKRTSIASFRSIHAQHVPKSELGVFLGFSDLFPTSYMFLLGNGKVIPRHIASLVNAAPFGWPLRTPLKSILQLPSPQPILTDESPAPMNDLVQLTSPPPDDQPLMTLPYKANQKEPAAQSQQIPSPQQTPVQTPAAPPVIVPHHPTDEATIASTPAPAPMPQPQTSVTPTPLSPRARLPRLAHKPAINVQQAGRDSVSREPHPKAVSFVSLPGGQQSAKGGQSTDMQDTAKNILNPKPSNSIPVKNQLLNHTMQTPRQQQPPEQYIQRNRQRPLLHSRKEKYSLRLCLWLLALRRRSRCAKPSSAQMQIFT